MNSCSHEQASWRQGELFLDLPPPEHLHTVNPRTSIGRYALSFLESADRLDTFQGRRYRVPKRRTPRDDRPRQTPASEVYWFDPADEDAGLYSPALSPLQSKVYASGE